MESLPIFRPRQALQAGDLTKFGQFARKSVDDIVNDAVCSGNAYWGFVATKTAATQVTLTAGRFYGTGGAVYPIDNPTTIDLTSAKPLVTQKWVAVVAWGTSIQVDPQPRMFLLDPVARTTEPQTNTMQDARQGNLGVIPGSEAPSPSYPTTDATVTVIAYVLMDPTGILQVVQFEPTQLPNLVDVEGQVDDLNTWQIQVGAAIESLATSLANLQAALAGYATDAEMQAVIVQLNLIWERLNRPATYIFYGRNYFLDNTGSDVTNPLFTAEINEGLGFKPGAVAVVNVSLANSLDPLCVVNSNYFIPQHTHFCRIRCVGYSRELQFSSLSYQSAVQIRQLQRRRRRHRFGTRFLPCSSTDWWRRGDLDPVRANLRIGSETFTEVTTAAYSEAVNPLFPGAVGSYVGSRRTNFWEDSYSEPHWDRVVSSHTVNGQCGAQIVLNATDGWVTQLGHHFTRVGNAGDIEVRVCHLDAMGTPDLSNVISSHTIPFSVINVSTNPVFTRGQIIETIYPCPPFFLKGGTRYAIVYFTAGLHYMAMSQDPADMSMLGGHHCYRDSTGAWVWLMDHVLRINIYYARPTMTRYEILLQPLQLAGGIASVDILADAHVPPSCSAVYQIQLNNRWYPLDVFGNGPDLAAAGYPALLPFRLVLTGTYDLCCGHGLGSLNTQVVLQGPAGDTYAYYSLAETLGSNSANIKIDSVLEFFDPIVHTYTVKLHNGATTYTADNVTDVVRPDGSLLRHSTFTTGLGAGIGAYVIEADGVTTDPAVLFKVSEMNQYAT